MTEELLTTEISDEDLPDARKKRLQEKMAEVEEVLSEPEEEPETEHEERSGTDYVLIRLLDEPGQWQEVARSSGRSGRNALDALAAELGEGTYVAVPARSWQPMTVTIETKIRIS